MKKIYTKKGDTGNTSLLGASTHVKKSSSRVWAYGCIDELNSALGVVRAMDIDPDTDQLLHKIQSELFDVGAELASAKNRQYHFSLQESSIMFLEHHIDRIDTRLQPLNHFILPGGSLVAAWLHVARTICRKAERYVVKLSQGRTPKRYNHCIPQ